MLNKVLLSSDVALVCMQHALSTEKEEIMGLLIGEVSYVMIFECNFYWFLHSHGTSERTKIRKHEIPEAPNFHLHFNLGSAPWTIKMLFETCLLFFHFKKQLRYCKNAIGLLTYLSHFYSKCKKVGSLSRQNIPRFSLSIINKIMRFRFRQMQIHTQIHSSCRFTTTIP